MKTLEFPSHLVKPVYGDSQTWSTVRFRRAKDSKGWVLLGVPTQVYPLVATRLFEHHARLIQKYESSSFVSLLFEASPALAAKLALTFPAPPGCEALRVAETGDRILCGKATQSGKVFEQALDPVEVG